MTKVQMLLVGAAMSLAGTGLAVAKPAATGGDKVATTSSKTTVAKHKHDSKSTAPKAEKSK